MTPHELIDKLKGLHAGLGDDRSDMEKIAATRADLSVVIDDLERELTSPALIGSTNTGYLELPTSQVQEPPLADPAPIKAP